MNENRERAHPLSETSAVALSSQNVSRVASVGRNRACSRAVEYAFSPTLRGARGPRRLQNSGVSAIGRGGFRGAALEAASREVSWDELRFFLFRELFRELCSRRRDSRFVCAFRSVRDGRDRRRRCSACRPPRASLSIALASVSRGDRLEVGVHASAVRLRAHALRVELHAEVWTRDVLQSHDLAPGARARDVSLRDPPIDEQTVVRLCFNRVARLGPRRRAQHAGAFAFERRRVHGEAVVARLLETFGNAFEQLALSVVAHGAHDAGSVARGVSPRRRAPPPAAGGRGTRPTRASLWLCRRCRGTRRRLGVCSGSRAPGTTRPA